MTLNPSLSKRPIARGLTALGALAGLCMVAAAPGFGAPAPSEGAPVHAVPPSAGSLVAPGPAPDLAIIYTGGVVGYVEPCG